MIASTATPSLNPYEDVRQLLQFSFMRNAFVAGTVIAVVAGVVGYFVVLRGLSFAAHALAHIGYAGATGSAVVGLAPIVGLQSFCIGAAMAMGALGKRIFGRDVAIGMVMAFSLGLGQLFVRLYRGGGNSTQSYSILFGDVLGITTDDIHQTIAISAVILLLMAALYRRLLFSSVDEDVAEARGLNVRLLGVAFLGLLGLTVGESVQVTGVLLVFALLIAPAAIAQRISARPLRAMALSVVLAVGFIWGTLVLAFYLPYPASFFLTTIAFASYLVARAGEVILVRGRSRVVITVAVP